MFYLKKRKQGKGAVERRALRRAAGNGVIDDVTWVPAPDWGQH